jgi:chromosome segregation ATPase
MDAVREKAESLEREVERLTEECGVARDEVKGLKYQLSSATMELQQTKELLAEREESLDSLRSKWTQKEELLREAGEGQELARAEAEGLRLELRELEREVGDQSSEMSTLSEQLTEKTYSRDRERAELLRAQTSLDVLQSQLEIEKQGFAKEAARLTEENNDIRRAFRRLLE